jgi:hypothetical protein
MLKLTQWQDASHKVWKLIVAKWDCEKPPHGSNEGGAETQISDALSPHDMWWKDMVVHELDYDFGIFWLGLIQFSHVFISIVNTQRNLGSHFLVSCYKPGVNLA